MLSFVFLYSVLCHCKFVWVLVQQNKQIEDVILELYFFLINFDILQNKLFLD